MKVFMPSPAGYRKVDLFLWIAYLLMFEMDVSIALSLSGGAIRSLCVKT